ncbi:uncharacterized protein J8A68_001378 [[Candida] subhashii]|uniref:Mannan endo-1,6-alpha-mannosidase n=1 Tax=[Candida] subhashii TaxID=561895 RepID=A0A8J5QG65_9ASCO|nr:uncharacterized protein J8A68_001378 [[Candida] subhashii]KAG7665069.1 hypothetical protein J8A68_001378 [[Candida] subhashii]
MDARWDSDCGGGLRWQIFTWNSGYDYKNAISNGCLFNLAARLARYTGNGTKYVEVAERVWNWMDDVGFFAEEADGTMRIYDGANVPNCTDVTTWRWSYTYGVFLSGCAYMYDFTNDTKWQTRADEILKASMFFFNNSIMQESTCQPYLMCNNDQRSFRSLFSRCLGLTSILMPETASTIRPLLEASAEGAAATCSGGGYRDACWQDWSLGPYDGYSSVLADQVSALEVINALLVQEPLTIKTGSSDDTNSETSSDVDDSVNDSNSATTGTATAGAAKVRILILPVSPAMAAWMIF